MTFLLLRVGDGGGGGVSFFFFFVSMVRIRAGFHTLSTFLDGVGFEVVVGGDGWEAWEAGLFSLHGCPFPIRMRWLGGFQENNPWNQGKERESVDGMEMVTGRTTMALGVKVWGRKEEESHTSLKSKEKDHRSHAPVVPCVE